MNSEGIKNTPSVFLVYAFQPVDDFILIIGRHMLYPSEPEFFVR